MGVGNYYLENAETVYVDHESVYGEYLLDENRYSEIDHDDDYRFLYEDFIRGLRALLPASYEEVDRFAGGRNEGVVVAENGFYCLTVVDWQTYFAVNLCLKTNDYGETHPLAAYHQDAAASSLFNKLSQQYPLRVRCGPWTTGTYTTH